MAGFPSFLSGPLCESGVFPLQCLYSSLQLRPVPGHKCHRLLVPKGCQSYPSTSIQLCPSGSSRHPLPSMWSSSACIPPCLLSGGSLPLLVGCRLPLYPLLWLLPHQVGCFNTCLCFYCCCHHHTLLAHSCSCPYLGCALPLVLCLAM